ncbi:hypothetical protein F0919_17940 [Taibaiella lutea]|uniref:Uncharacterized protein n=1 Tax=Taibaiella lutea TaxID=2608001 RepID=A0A5M6CCE8_9BACT|nr:hypothetical protein [Taibaiella lutea]KAA5532663.1 hypothetical protein F0919_17940 [Taibaiella lutea]
MINLPEFITLGQAIDFHNQYGELIELRLKEIEEMDNDIAKDFELIDFEISNAFWLISYLTGKVVDELQSEITINEALDLYRHKISPLFNPEREYSKTVAWNENIWYLPAQGLRPDSMMTFGEFIDSKVMAQNVIEEKGSKWEIIYYIAAIFLRQEEEFYSPGFLYENSIRLELFRSLPLEIAVLVAQWYESFTEYLQEYFPVFSESQIKSGNHIKSHLNQWGWVNFLKSVAATKVFDIANSGMNSIDCARAAKAYDVLVSASEEKQYNEAVALDTEAAYKK